MADLILPPWVCVARARMQYIDSTGVSRSEFTGKAKTASKGGDRLSASLELGPTITTTAESEMQRAALISFLMRQRGRQNRVYLYDRANRLRGSFPATELLTNNTFENGTTGWTAATGWNLSVSDRMMRGTYNRAGTGARIFSQNVALSAQTPYVVRAMSMAGQGGIVGVGLIDATVQAIDTTRVIPGYSAAAVAANAAGTVSIYFYANSGTTGLVAGDYALCPWISLSRCALVDNGSNFLLRSDDFTNAAWTKTRLTASGTTTAPDGSSTANSLVEDTSNNTHLVEQASSVSAATNDYAFAVALKANTRTWAALIISENASGSVVRAYFNLASGVAGTVAVGANWINQRSFISPLGNGWYYCCVIARKTNAATVVTGRIELATGDNANSYLGNGSFIHGWRGTLAQTSTPPRLIQTVATASTGSNQNGSALYIKGLPVSTNGLLLENDQVEVITSYGSELKFVTAALNSDAAGLGYLQFEPPLRGVPAENAPVIIHQPMGKFLFSGDLVGFENDPGVTTRASADFEEA